MLLARKGVERVLSALETEVVLVDIGASGEPPPIWKALMPFSVYVGFDPDSREVQEVSNSGFRRALLVNEAVTADAAQDEVRFYLTRSPYCSSTLEPDLDALKNYLFSDLFIVENEAVVPAATLNSVLHRLSIERVDWLKVDSQGTDLRLFESLQPEIRSRVLALDVEPGLIDVYQGEDLFVDTHRALTQSGFWLSNLDVHGNARMRRETLHQVVADHPDITEELLSRTVRVSPAWCEARYLRTLEWAAQAAFTKREYGTLWAFAMLDQQYGFALDLIVQYERSFGPDAISRLMQKETLAQIRRLRNRNLPLTVARALLPTSLKHNLKKLLLAVRPS
ncbi:MAG TPA: FkbM family methyltransferase [Ardenticatenaceae bacterium]|jgi:hypothetical protein